MTLRRRKRVVDDVNVTLYKRHVPAGFTHKTPSLRHFRQTLR